jgi:hypothetical protein
MKIVYLTKITHNFILSSFYFNLKISDIIFIIMINLKVLVILLCYFHKELMNIDEA